MTTRAEQKEKRRWEILETALDLFIRRGYSATKIKDIADAVPMSVGLLFHYFESKEILYKELIRLGSLGPREMIGQIEEKEPLAFFSRCAQQTLFYAGNSMFTAKMFVLMANACHSEDIPKQAGEAVAATDFYHELVPLIEEGQAAGVIRRGSALSLCTAFWSALQGVIAAYALDPGIPLPEAEWIVDIIRAK